MHCAVTITDVVAFVILISIKTILRDLLISVPLIYILLNKFSVVYINRKNIKKRLICCEYESYRSCSYDTLCNFFSFTRIPVSLQCGTEWEDMLCTIFHFTQNTQHESTEGLRYGDSKGHYKNV